MANLLDKLIYFVEATKKKFAIFETVKIDKNNFLSYIFFDPVEELILYSPNEIKKFFNKLDEHLKNGFYLAGFFSYELGYFLDYKDKYFKKTRFPLAFLYVFKNPIIFDHKKNKFIDPEEKNIYSFLKNFRCPLENFKISSLNLNVKEDEYIENIFKIKEYIFSGDTYQINYTIKAKFKILGSIVKFYNTTKKSQKVPYSALIKTKDFYILSFSPELFFRKSGDILYVKPMKGTAPRGKNLLQDEYYKRKLKNSIKERAENIMIVDLLRNDLGKISPYGNVEVEKLFEVEKYDTLFQMTSTIKTKLLDNIDFYKIFKAIFPSGSVTGAPKIRSMQIIRDLEKEERKVYTGVIGFFSPKKEAIFNVAIRTVLVDKNRNAEMGVGSGIVADSDPKREFEECKLKANFLFRKLPNFRLIETILYSPLPLKISHYDNLILNIDENAFQDGFFLLSLHLKRLRESSKYFDFKYDEDKIVHSLKNLKKYLDNNYYKVRLLLSKDGSLKLQTQLLKNFEFCCKTPVKIKMSNILIDEENIFLYHKTTNRKIYNKEYNKYTKLGYFDVLFINTKKELTETSRCNVFLKIDGKFFSPPTKSGLLAGVFRSFILKKNSIFNKKLYVEDLMRAQAIYITNSVIGIRKAYLE